MISLKLHPELIRNITEIYGDQGLQWLAELPRMVDRFCIQWNFQFLKEIPELSYSFVGIVQLESGQKAILKIAPDKTRSFAEFNWLTSFKQGVPEVYQFNEECNVLLMEYLDPGYTLKKLVRDGKDDQATVIICDVIRQLQGKQSTNSSFKHLSELGFSFAKMRNHFDAKLLDKAETLYRELTSHRSGDVLLHGDLHHDNILMGGQHWKVIDPHGYTGDPVAEVGAMIRNPYDCFPNDKPLDKVLQRRFEIVCEELPFDRHKIKAWFFCITVLSSAWTYEDFGKVSSSDIEMADLIDKLKL